MQQLKSRLNILIAGGGISGLTLACLLERQGHIIDIIERSPGWNTSGGGITLTLNGMKLLQQIGIGCKIESIGNPINKICITDDKDRQLSVFNLSKYAFHFAKTLTIHRNELHSLLADELKSTHIYFGKSCESFSNTGNTTKVYFSDGSHSDYDLIVGCDGMYSTVRKNYFVEQSVNYAGYVCWRFVVDTSAKTQRCDTLKEMWGRGRRFGIVPLNDNLFHCFASLSTSEPERYRDINLMELRNLFSGFKGAVPELLDNITDETDIYFNRLESVYNKSWIKNNVVLIGDAAHGMTPNLTQGASMAIEDAVCLSNALYGASDLKTCLYDFYNERRKRILQIQRKSDWLGKVGQLRSPLFSSLRNYCWKQVPDRWIQYDFEKLLIRNSISYVQ